MNTLLPQEFEKIASLYLDGELAQKEAKRFEEYLEQNPAAAADFEILKTSTRALRSKKTLPHNDWFWLQLSNSIEAKEIKSKAPLFNFRSANLFPAMLVVTSVVIGIIYFKEADVFKKYFEEKKNLVANNLLSGNILPFFSNLDNDKVLQFALLGNLPIDSARTTELQVTHDEEKGARIEFAVIDKPLQAQSITVKEFCRQVGIRQNQKIIVDSLLEHYTEQLQASVLVDEKNTIAINEELTNLNKVMVSTIAAALEPQQRIKFQEFLETRNAPYTVVASNVPVTAPEKIFRHIRSFPRSNKFVVISADTVGIAEVQMNLDSIREHSQKMMQKSQPEKQFALDVMRESLEKQKQINKAISSSENPITIVNSEDAVQIHFNNELNAPFPIEFGFEEFVKPRVLVREIPRNNQIRVYTNRVKVFGDSAMVWEMQADTVAVKFFRSVPQGAMQFEIVDSAMNSPKMRIKMIPEKRRKAADRVLEHSQTNEEHLIDIDSLLNEANKKSKEQIKKAVEL